MSSGVFFTVLLRRYAVGLKPRLLADRHGSVESKWRREAHDFHALSVLLSVTWDSGIDLASLHNEVSEEIQELSYGAHRCLLRRDAVDYSLLRRRPEASVTLLADRHGGVEAERRRQSRRHSYTVGVYYLALVR